MCRFDLSSKRKNQSSHAHTNGQRLIAQLCRDVSLCIYLLYMTYIQNIAIIYIQYSTAQRKKQEAIPSNCKFFWDNLLKIFDFWGKGTSVFGALLRFVNTLDGSKITVFRFCGIDFFQVLYYNFVIDERNLYPRHSSYGKTTIQGEQDEKEVVDRDRLPCDCTGPCHLFDGHDEKLVRAGG